MDRGQKIGLLVVFFVLVVFSCVYVINGAQAYEIGFFVGFYGGLVCCVLAIFVCALYTFIRRFSITRCLVAVIVACIVSLLCLVPAFIWFHASLNMIAVLCYVVFFGWVLPIGVTFFYCIVFCTRAVGVLGPAKKQASTLFHPPRYQSGVLAPFVFGGETPWGWLEYQSGNFRGQRLALKRAIVTLGRNEDCDIWLDDEGASRLHAEIAWQDNIVYLTDCNSLNGTLLNGLLIQGTVILSSNDTLAIGVQRFLFMLAEQAETSADLDDPLAHHTWRSSFELQDSRETTRHSLPLSASRLQGQCDKTEQEASHAESRINASPLKIPSTISTPPSLSTPLLPAARGFLLLHDGVRTWERVYLQSLSLIVGSDPQCDLPIPHCGLAFHHVRFLRHAQGDLVQDLSSLYGGEGTLVNNISLRNVHLLQPGDKLCLGRLHITYLYVVQNVQTKPPIGNRVLDPLAKASVENSSFDPFSSRSFNGGPMPLRLPSRPKGT
jgi:pSer/pThr/pTyr-binding forkhead associated (FHA) protein